MTLASYDTRSGTSSIVAREAAATDRNRVLWVDYGKGWCIVLVVMMHATLGVGLSIGETGWLHDIVAFAKPFRMPDFFVISGLFLGRIIDQPWRVFLDKRVIHFVYFYALWFLASLVLKSGELGLHDPGSFLDAYLWGFVQPFSSLWFIQILPVFFVAMRLCKHVPVPMILVAATGLHVLAAFYPDGGIYSLSSKMTGFITLDSFALFFIYFATGHIFRDRIFAFAKAAGAHPRTAILGLALWAVFEEISVQAGLPQIPGVTLIYGFAGATAVVALAALLARTDRIPWLAYCGRHSLVVYLSFFIPMAASRVFLLKNGMDRRCRRDFLLVVTIIAIVWPGVAPGCRRAKHAVCLHLSSTRLGPLEAVAATIGGRAMTSADDRARRRLQAACQRCGSFSDARKTLPNPIATLGSASPMPSQSRMCSMSRGLRLRR